MDLLNSPTVRLAVSFTLYDSNFVLPGSDLLCKANTPACCYIFKVSRASIWNVRLIMDIRYFQIPFSVVESSFKTTAKTCWKAWAVTFYNWNKVSFARKCWLTLTYHNSCANFASLSKLHFKILPSVRFRIVLGLSTLRNSDKFSNWEERLAEVYILGQMLQNGSTLKGQFWRRIPNSWLRCHWAWGENKTNSLFATGENLMQWCREPQSKRGGCTTPCIVMYHTMYCHVPQYTSDHVCMVQFSCELCIVCSAFFPQQTIWSKCFIDSLQQSTSSLQRGDYAKYYTVMCKCTTLLNLCQISSRKDHLTRFGQKTGIYASKRPLT